MTERRLTGHPSAWRVGPGVGPLGLSSEPLSVTEADELLRLAAQLLVGRPQGQRALLFEVLAGRAVDPGGRANVEAALAAIVESTLAGLWEDGWQPADLVHQAGRGASAAHASLAVDWVARQARALPLDHAPAGWLAQLDEVGAEVWWAAGEAQLGCWSARSGVAWARAVEVAVEVLARLLVLPRQPHLCAPPSRWSSGGGAARSGPAGSAHHKVLAKVRALLAKAESTDFEAEAAALTAKAQELITRHAIDRALLVGGTAGGERPGGRRIPVEDPYAAGKSMLLSRIAAANRCRAVRHPGLGFCTVFGDDGDLDAVELLHASLLVQATAAMVAAGSHVDASGTTRTRSFRSSFLVAFAARIGDRLDEATEREVSAAAEGDGRLLPVLAARGAAVDEAVAAAFPTRTVSRSHARNRAGWVAGRLAADAADLAAGRDGLAGQRRLGA